MITKNIQEDCGNWVTDRMWISGRDQATSHYLSQWWSSSPTHICVIRRQWVNLSVRNILMFHRYLLHPLNHIHIWQVSAQQTCGDTFQGWSSSLIGKPCLVIVHLTVILRNVVATMNALQWRYLNSTACSGLQSRNNQSSASVALDKQPSSVLCRNVGIWS